MDCCPKGKNRIEAAIQQEGYNYKDGDRSSGVLDSALVGSTVYLAVHHEDKSKGIDLVYGVVILTRYEDHEFMTKPIGEDSGPYSYDCPRRILKLLSPTDNEYALQWRSLCEKRHKGKASDGLAGIAIGSRIRLLSGTKKGIELVAYRLGSRKVFVDWSDRKYMTQKMVRDCGFELVTA